MLSIQGITESAKRHIPGLYTVAKVPGEPGLWLVAFARKGRP